jgi:hypothetical protein
MDLLCLLLTFINVCIGSNRSLIVFVDWDGTLGPERKQPTPTEPYPSFSPMPPEAKMRIENIFSEIVSLGGEIIILTASEKESLNQQDSKRLNAISSELVQIESTHSEDMRNVPEDKVSKMFEICEKKGVAFPRGALFLDNDKNNVIWAKKSGIHTVCFPPEVQMKTFPHGKVYGDPREVEFYQHLDFLLQDFKAKLNWNDVAPKGLLDTPEIGPSCDSSISDEMVLPESQKEFIIERQPSNDLEEKTARLLTLATARKNTLAERRSQRSNTIF